MAAILAALALVTAANAASINEIRIDQSSTDNDEYFELAGAADESLDGLTYLVIGDGATGSGTVEYALDLAGYSIPADGYFLGVESTFTLASGADAVVEINFENSDNVSHFLVSGFTGANGDDLDNRRRRRSGCHTVGERRGQHRPGGDPGALGTNTTVRRSARTARSSPATFTVTRTRPATG